MVINYVPAQPVGKTIKHRGTGILYRIVNWHREKGTFGIVEVTRDLPAPEIEIEDGDPEYYEVPWFTGIGTNFNSPTN